MYYLQSRYYDPEVGRFLNADAYASTGQGLLGNNMFAYCLNSPIRYEDQHGQAVRKSYNNDNNEPFDDTGSRGGNGPFDAYQYILDQTYAAQHGGQGKGYSSYGQMKADIGSAGNGKHWHHIVERCQTGKSGFSQESVNNTSNIIALDPITHGIISGHYSSKQWYTGGLTVRDWLAGQSFEFQFWYGIGAIISAMFGGK